MVSTHLNSRGVVYVPDAGEFLISGQNAMNRAVDGDIAAWPVLASPKYSKSEGNRSCLEFVSESDPIWQEQGVSGHENLS